MLITVYLDNGIGHNYFPALKVSISREAATVFTVIINKRCKGSEYAPVHLLPISQGAQCRLHAAATRRPGHAPGQFITVAAKAATPPWF